MKVFNQLSEIENIKPTALALGNFDAIHKGHRELIKRTVDSGKKYGLEPAVFTFSNHPRNYFAGRSVVKNILSSEDKLDLIKELGIKYLFSLPFDEYYHTMDPKKFVKDLLIDKFNVQSVFCGFNFHYGKDAEGSSESLIEAAEAEGFDINVLEPFIVDGELVSSTLIRQLISQGNMEKVNKLMGRNYSIKGTVVVGNKIGRTIGFPTTNIVVDDNMVWPDNGVYITTCEYNGTVYPSVTNVGFRPTIGDNKKFVETHMFNMNEEIYGKDTRVEFIKNIRNEREFDSVEELTARIEIDKNIAEEYHNQNNFK